MFPLGKKTALAGFCVFIGLLGAARAADEYSVLNPHPDLTLTADGKWKINDMSRPKPPLVKPLPEAELAARSKAPADAIILFDGGDLSKWHPSRYKVEDGIIKMIARGGCLIETNEAFGSCRFHLEWCTQNPPQGTGQHRGNGGVYFMARYNIQILDNYDNMDTYPDGMAGALYGGVPPTVLPIRPPGQWQYYDGEFYRPIFSGDGKLLRPARLTLDFNGVRVQDHAAFDAPFGPPPRRPYVAHRDKAPLFLEDHGEVVNYRNIWIVPLEDKDLPLGAANIK
jgi:hypothetical protein